MLNRLLGIIYILLNKGTVTAGELAQRFEVSVRTIYRDIEALSMAGIPVYTKKGKNGGISLTEQFVLDKMLVSKEEQLQILAALGSLEAVGAQKEKEILDKLGDFFQVKAKNWVEIDFSDWSGRRQALYTLLKEAILNRKVLEFDYYGQYRDMTHRFVEPVQLFFKEYTWYLRAYCRERQAMRLFKVLRMKRVRVTGEVFTERTEVSEVKQVSSSIICEEPEVYLPSATRRVVIKIDASESYRVYDRFEEEELTVLPDGSFIVTLDYMLDDWVYGVILSFGPAACVLEPEDVRQEMAARIEKMLEKYEGGAADEAAISKTR